MTEAHTMGRELQDEVLNTVRKSQTVVIEAIQAWASKAQSITAELPGLNMPFSDKLPKPQELIASSYDFAAPFLPAVSGAIAFRTSSANVRWLASSCPAKS